MGIQRELEGHSKSTWALKTPDGNSSTFGTQELKGHSATQGTCTLRHFKGTWGLKAVEALESHYLADSFII